MPLSERTKKYVQAFIRDGDEFDQNKWLAQVRAEEVAKQTGADVGEERPNKITPCPVASVPNRNVGAYDQASPSDRQRPTAKTETAQRATTTALKRLSRAWSDSQCSRNRDAIYGYLSGVFSLIQKYRQRDRLKRLIRKAQQFAELPRNKQADAYTAVIRATTNDEIDHRAISKYARALRYCRKHKGDQPLEAFIKCQGGINACADLYSQRH
jgi:hypothetical protein